MSIVKERSPRNIIIAGLGRKKRIKPRYSPEEKAAIISEMERPVAVTWKGNENDFKDWLEKQVQRSSNRYYEAKRKNFEDWIVMDCLRKAQQIRQVQINYLAIPVQKIPNPKSKLP